MKQEETRLLKQIMVALGNEADIVLWRNNVGALYDVTGRLVKYGLAPGSADLVGVLAPFGRMFCLEVKTTRSGSKQSKDQENWQRVVTEMGGFYAVARSVEQAQNMLRVARATARLTSDAPPRDALRSGA